MKDDNQYDGSNMSKYSLATLFEMQMWEDISIHRDKWEDIKPKLQLRAGKVIGKAVLVSTVESEEVNSPYLKLWQDSEFPEKPNGLYRIFVNAYKSDEDENM